MTRLLSLIAILLAFALWPAAVRAHIGGESVILVPRDHVMPGETFPIIGEDLGSGATILLRLVQGEREAVLGTIVTQPDGHFQTSAQLPADFPHGYAELIASSDDGSQMSTWVLVGPRENAPAGGPPASPARPDWWLDPSVLVLVGILGAAGLALVGLTIRSNRREQALATTVPVRRPAPRKLGTKARRRRS